VVRTFYVEHDIDGSEAETSVLDFILSDKRVLADKAEVISTLASVGFNDERQGTCYRKPLWWLEDEAGSCPCHVVQG
jgi:hypothetical protein